MCTWIVIAAVSAALLAGVWVRKHFLDPQLAKLTAENERLKAMLGIRRDADADCDGSQLG